VRSRCLVRPLTGRAAVAHDRARAQHPLYATANSTYGSGTASEFEKISQWHGQKARTGQRAQCSAHSAARRNPSGNYARLLRLRATLRRGNAGHARTQLHCGER
jgi:hypothetical protein